MKKQDYELIADWANYCKDTVLDQHALEILAAKLQADNPKFDRNRFLALCGIEQQWPGQHEGISAMAGDTYAAND